MILPSVNENNGRRRSTIFIMLMCYKTYNGDRILISKKIEWVLTCRHNSNGTVLYEVAYIRARSATSAFLRFC